MIASLVNTNNCKGIVQHSKRTLPTSSDYRSDPKAAYNIYTIFFIVDKQIVRNMNFIH